MAPSVAMNGGILPAVTMRPLRPPKIMPAATEIRMATMYAGAPVRPIAPSQPPFAASMSVMVMAPTATSVEPTARSMPPEMMTNVMPSAMIPTLELLRRMFIQLLIHAPNHSPKLA